MDSGIQTSEAQYPLQFSVDYPDRDLNRLTTAFRIIVAIPILVLAGTLGREGTSYGHTHHVTTFAVGSGGILFLAPLLMIVFRQKYPRWWYDWNLELLRFTNRIAAYFALMDDRYPSTDEQQAVRLDFDYPDAKRALTRRLRLRKSRPAIPPSIL